MYLLRRAQDAVAENLVIRLRDPWRFKRLSVRNMQLKENHRQASFVGKNVPELRQCLVAFKNTTLSTI